MDKHHKTRIVIKLGSLTITEEEGGVSSDKINRMCRELKELHQNHFFPILVSSGAINSGRSFLKNYSKLNQNKKVISTEQAAAAVGQPLLMKHYLESFEKVGMKCAQLLVTHEDFKNKERFLNIKNTLQYLIESDIIPIINENDTVSYNEITVGDNDQLAVMITETIDAKKLIILSEVDGLYDKNPKLKDAQKFHEVAFNHDFKNVTFLGKSSAGRGGMSTKVQAIRKLTPHGVDVILGSYLFPQPVLRLLHHQGGTLFRGNPHPNLNKRKPWPQTLVKNNCWLVVDDGCAQALMEKQSSLLPVGILKVQGLFKRGDAIHIKHKGKIIGTGLAEYDHQEMNQIKGKKTQELSSVLKKIFSKVAIHKNNLLLIKSK